MNFFKPKNKNDKLMQDQIESDKNLNRERLDLLDNLKQVH